MRVRLTTFLIVALLASGGVLYLALGKFVYLAFDDMERSQASANLSLAVGALRDEAQSLNTWVRDYGPWDETYAFAAGEDAEYIARNFAADTIENLDFDIILFTDNEGSIVWSFLPPSITRDELNHRGLPVYSSINDNWESTLGVTGIHLLTPDSAYLIAAHPILTTDAEGPVRGTLLFGRVLDNARLETLIRSSVADFHVEFISETEDTPQLVDDIMDNNGVYLSMNDHGRIFASTILRDLHDESRIILQTAAHRDATAQGAVAILAVMSVMALFWIATLIVWLILNRRSLRLEKS